MKGDLVSLQSQALCSLTPLLGLLAGLYPSHLTGKGTQGWGNWEPVTEHHRANQTQSLDPAPSPQHPLHALVLPKLTGDPSRRSRLGYFSNALTANWGAWHTDTHPFHAKKEALPTLDNQGCLQKLPVTLRGKITLVCKLEVCTLPCSDLACEPQNQCWLASGQSTRKVLEWY